MARPLVLSNGELHVGLNNYGLVHDLYFPYVGFENHAASAGPDLRHKIGVWVDGKVSWFDQDPNWTFQFGYPHDSLIGHTVATNTAIGVMVEFDDAVDAKINAFMRNVHVVNLWDSQREVRLFLHQAFVIGDSMSSTDTAQYLPDSDAILHYRGRRAFVVAGQYDGRPFDQHSIGLFGIEDHEGTYKDAEDGELGGGSIEHGRVDSIFRFTLHLDGHSSGRVHYWIAAGRSTREALTVNKELSEKGIDARLQITADWWHDWMQPALKVAQHVPENHRKLFLQSVMVLKSQMDNGGAVIASTDSSLLNYSRDTYGYSWPRDGAYVMWPMIRMGYYDEARQFFEFSKAGLHPGGYLMHKYRADGALGSSWHPYTHAGGIVGPPIQEDETALVLLVFCHFYAQNPDPALIKEFYGSMVVPMADFLANYIDQATGLPKPSYDLWEEVYLTTTYTTAVTYAALLAVADLAATAEDNHNAVKWRAAAEDIRTAAHKHLYNHERQAFYKGVLSNDGVIERNAIIDSSGIFGVFLYGLFEDGSQELDSSVESLLGAFGAHDTHVGLPRYENDFYRRKDDSINGNWWYITTCWLVQYEFAHGKKEQALERLDWLMSLVPDTGMISEQIDPRNGEQIAPSPLTWSHAQYVSTLLDIADEASA